MYCFWIRYHCSLLANPVRPSIDPRISDLHYCEREIWDHPVRIVTIRSLDLRSDWNAKFENWCNLTSWICRGSGLQIPPVSYPCDYCHSCSIKNSESQLTVEGWIDAPVPSTCSSIIDSELWYDVKWTRNRVAFNDILDSNTIVPYCFPIRLFYITFYSLARCKERFVSALKQSTVVQCLLLVTYFMNIHIFQHVAQITKMGITTLVNGLHQIF